MTGRYDWAPMPHVLDARCPTCRALATFEFAEVVRLRAKADIPFFRASPHFEYRRFPAQGWRQAWHGAIFYPNLAARLPGGAGPLPAGYSREDWAHSRYLYRSTGLDIGTLVCTRCHRPRKHDLSWPRDAFYQIDYRRSVLWAFHRESLLELRDYIASTKRVRSRYRWQAFLLRVPSHFLRKSARDEVVHRLDKLLA